MSLSERWLRPDWPAPAQVRSCITTQWPSAEHGPYGQFNLGSHVGDELSNVRANRQQLADSLGCQPVWLDQVHGTDVVEAMPHAPVATADACWTATPGVACAILTADCLPALFCTRDGQRVAAAHAGWRGLLAGVLENTVQALNARPEDILVWLGPCIGPSAFEVGPEVREAFVAHAAEAELAFTASNRTGHWYANLQLLARQRLAEVGVTQIGGDALCTYNDERFYSYRRASITGRFASLIWIAMER